ncbi:uncharacterized protein LOC111692132 [Anoplophora glabripennis]|uniref:uncharacterized protein LOC111692132 n=1 Tax=Anoplophora glabripennis TaxID=217634 RepID=UPI000C771052|nr:uncharacterized protein LOC111692132 [Anoplophora glabripennis]
MREAITVKERLAITLRYLATVDSYTSLQYIFRVSKQSISRIVPEVCDAIIEALHDYVELPSTEEEWLAVAKEFEEKWNFPWNSGTEYYNYKNFFSIVLFAFVDANYNFMYVDIGCQGWISDGGVFKNTNLYRKLERNELNIPAPCPLQVPYLPEGPYMLLGDKAFSLNEYTMKPFEGFISWPLYLVVASYRINFYFSPNASPQLKRTQRVPSLTIRASNNQNEIKTGLRVLIAGPPLQSLA